MINKQKRSYKSFIAKKTSSSGEIIFQAFQENKNDFKFWAQNAKQTLLPEAEEKLSPSQIILSGLNPMSPDTFSKERGSLQAPP